MLADQLLVNEIVCFLRRVYAISRRISFYFLILDNIVLQIVIADHCFCKICKLLFNSIFFDTISLGILLRVQVLHTVFPNNFFGKFNFFCSGLLFSQIVIPEGWSGLSRWSGWLRWSGPFIFVLEMVRNS